MVHTAQRRRAMSARTRPFLAQGDTPDLDLAYADAGNRTHTGSFTIINALGCKLDRLDRLDHLDRIEFAVLSCSSRPKWSSG